MQEAHERRSNGRWFRRAAVLVVLAVAGAGLRDAVTYDRGAGLADYAWLKHHLVHGYASLDWIRDRRGLVAGLERQTTQALAVAHAHLRASLALRAFLRRFDDPYLRLEPRRRPSPPASRGSTLPVPQAVTTEAVTDCALAVLETLHR